MLANLLSNVQHDKENLCFWYGFIAAMKFENIFSEKTIAS